MRNATRALRDLRVRSSDLELLARVEAGATLSDYELCELEALRGRMDEILQVWEAADRV